MLKNLPIWNQETHSVVMLRLALFWVDGSVPYTWLVNFIERRCSGWVVASHPTFHFVVAWALREKNQTMWGMFVFVFVCWSKGRECCCNQLLVAHEIHKPEHAWKNHSIENMVPTLDEHGFSSAEKGHQYDAFYNQLVFSFYSENVWTSHSIGITPL